MNIQTVKVGIISTNCYILTDEKTNEAIVIDPGSKCGQIIDAVKDKNVKYILCYGIFYLQRLRLF